MEENQYIELGLINPDQLVELIKSTNDHTRLTFLLEGLPIEKMELLISFFLHPEPLVREGVYLALTRYLQYDGEKICGSEIALRFLESAARTEDSPGLRKMLDNIFKVLGTYKKPEDFPPIIVEDE